MKSLSIALCSLAIGVVAGTFLSGTTQGATEHQFMNLPGRTDNNPYSNMALVGDTLYLAGDIGIDDATGRPPEKVEDEVKILMDNLVRRLEMADMSIDDVVMVNVYCPDLSLYVPFNNVYRTYFKENFPARAFLGSGPLLLDGRFEMTAVAVRQ